MAVAVSQVTFAPMNTLTGQLVTPGTAVVLTDMGNNNPTATTPVRMFSDSTGTATAGSNSVNTDSAGNVTVFVTPDGSDGTGRYKYTPAGLPTQILQVPLSTQGGTVTGATNFLVGPKFPCDPQGTWNVVSNGLANNGSDITTGLVALMTTANSSAIGKGPRARATIFFPAGIYGVQPNLVVPERVSFLGEGRDVVELRNLGTTYGNGLTFRGSGVFCRGITYNGQNANQSGTNTGYTIGFVKDAGISGNSGSIGLGSNIAAGATSFTAVNASSGSTPLLPGDMVAFWDSSNYEVARVAPTYTIGSTTVPIVGQFAYAHTTATTQVTIFSTENVLEDCTIRAIGFVGVEGWHSYGTIFRNNVVRDATDTGMGVSAGGSRNCQWIGNNIEQIGKWNIFIDGATNNIYGPTGRCTIGQNTCRLIAGGTAYECIGVASGGPCEDIEIASNHLDITSAGDAGVSLRVVTGSLIASTRVNVHDNFVYCNSRSGTQGVVFYAPASGNTAIYTMPQIHHNTIVLPALAGIQLGDQLTAQIVANTITMANAANNAIAITTNNTVQQHIVSIGNTYSMANASSVVFGSAGNAPTLSPTLKSVGDIALGTYFLINGLQSGWVYTAV